MAYALVARGACGTGYTALRELADKFPQVVARAGGLRVALMVGNTISAVEHTCTDSPDSENELLVYLRVHGVIPVCATNYMVAALRNTCSEYRGVYADQLMETCASDIPENAAFDETLCGSITFAPYQFTMLRAPLARASEFFRSPLMTNSIF